MPRGLPSITTASQGPNSEQRTALIAPYCQSHHSDLFIGLNRLTRIAAPGNRDSAAATSLVQSQRSKRLRANRLSTHEIRVEHRAQAADLAGREVWDARGARHQTSTRPNSRYPCQPPPRFRYISTSPRSSFNWAVAKPSSALNALVSFVSTSR